jgi:hypothetical protein
MFVSTESTIRRSCIAGYYKTSTQCEKCNSLAGKWSGAGQTGFFCVIVSWWWCWMCDYGILWTQRAPTATSSPPTASSLSTRRSTGRPTPAHGKRNRPFYPEPAGVETRGSDAGCVCVTGSATSGIRGGPSTPVDSSADPAPNLGTTTCRPWGVCTLSTRALRGRRATGAQERGWWWSSSLRSQDPTAHLRTGYAPHAGPRAPPRSASQRSARIGWTRSAEPVRPSAG